MNIDINNIKKTLIDRYPFFGSIIDSLDYIETKNCISSDGIPTAGTNGNTVYYHADFINGLSSNQQTFVFAHEICHVAFDHMNRGKDKNQEVWNYATDAVINAFLKKDGLELIDNCIDIPWAINYDAEEMYKKLMKEKNNKNNQTKDVGHDTHSLWNEKTINKNNDKLIKEIKKEFQKIGEKEILKKKTSDELKKILEKDKEKIKKQKSNTPNDSTYEQEITFDDVGTSYPLINWPLILKRPIEITELDWSYKNAYIEDGVLLSNLEENFYQLFYETEIILDTSGSINDILLKNFLKECKNILNFSKIKVGCFDVKFYGFNEIKNINDIDNFKLIGRGGTDFEVAINSFSKNADNKIIFTDGMAYVPTNKIDIIWIVFGDNIITPNGGKVIYINEKDLVKTKRK